MSARSVSKGLLDARLSRLRAQVGLAAGGGSLLPLPRTKIIDGGSTVAGQSGSWAEPFKTIQGWLTTLGPTGSSAADNEAIELGLVLPTLNGYAENLTIPAYRSVELRALYSSLIATPLELTGNITWNNAGPPGGTGAHPPPVAVFGLHNLSVNGTLTVTDDGTVPADLILTGDVVGAGLTGLLDCHLATDVRSIAASNYALLGGVTSTTGATGAIVGVIGTELSGAVTCKSLSCEAAEMSTTAIHVGAGAQAAVILGSNFLTATTITGLGGSGLLFDGPSWMSFLEVGGTVVTSFVLVIGGYFGAPVEGAALADNIPHALTLSLNGTGATAGYTGGGNHYTLPVGNVLGADLVLTLATAGALPGDGIRITRNEIASPHALVVKDDVANILATIPNSNRGFVDCRFNGTHFVNAGCGAGVTA